jgi:hypothetical protein
MKFPEARCQEFEVSSVKFEALEICLVTYD